MRVSLPFGLSLLAIAAGCSGATDPLGGSHDGGASGSSSGGGSSGSSGSGSGGSGSSSGGASSGSGGGSGSGSSSGASSSSGGSGSGSSSGGCPPCDVGNVNLPGGACDLDCSGTPNPPGPCDAALTAAGPASDFAKALGICKMATGGSWGLVSATYTQGYDSTAVPNAGQHGLAPGFGPAIKAREGANLGVLSSGFAMVCDDASPTAVCTASGMTDPYFKGEQTAMDMTGGVATNGSPPPGYPKASTACTTAPSTVVNDTIGVTLVIQTPKNVSGFSFDFDFYSSEWPEYACSQFNDQFVAWLQSAAWLGNVGDLNVAFDTMGNVISVNTPFLTRCTAGTPIGCSGTGAATGTATCPAGPAELQGTGFYNLGTYCTSQSTGGASTGWLTTTAPVQGGETITLQLIIWDTGDPNWDSSVLLDDFKWYGAQQVVKTTPSP